MSQEAFGSRENIRRFSGKLNSTKPIQRDGFPGDAKENFFLDRLISYTKTKIGSFALNAKIIAVKLKASSAVMVIDYFDRNFLVLANEEAVDGCQPQGPVCSLLISSFSVAHIQVSLRKIMAKRECNS